ncbi:hypothetical protein [Poritiphilus flavus]|uniref:Cellobiose phosphorylase n=1 Tax=Poritiphilus flavus TaxID=2697053 RepID=A0A6L9E9Y3_9FLAO|nr:hypothetical protein [Poritiphilus flavus]NAS11474.1 hypothetical protein [Poritiphilus flavus]
MPTRDIFIGKSKADHAQKEISGKLVRFETEDYYKVSNSDAMRPFFMSVVSDTNHWMFISSNGGLSAGRKNSEFALFPYYTDDKITESAAITGSKTLFQVFSQDKLYLWEPFSDRYPGIYEIHRNLYKNSLGNKIVFEEINHSLGLTFRYHWNSSKRFGFVKRSTLVNHSGSELKVVLLDGIQNIMPYGVNSFTQNASSNLVDAYKKSELEAAFGLGIYALSAIIVDKAEPSEALKATTVWSAGLANAKYLLSSLQLDSFRKGGEIKQETDIRAEKGAYFLHAEISLGADSERQWMIVAEVNQTKASIAALTYLIRSKTDLMALVQEDVENGSRQLLELNAAADGLQLTADKLRNTRHFANSLFNIMRGGIFDDGYTIEKADFLKYLSKANTEVYQQKNAGLNALSGTFSLSQLWEVANADENTDFKRLAMEYMPLKFSRRHGDPSRPWNRFSINTETEDGKKVLDYEGNWRDIFQNWEALAHSYPAFIDSMIFKFLNATTFDGYNPYRVTKDGFDWEIIEPDDPWSYIGYWGDHQIIYLLKFLEFIEDHYPTKLASYFNENMFVYANVPYKIKGYQSILENPKDTIDFDEALDEKINKERLQLGADAALLKDRSNEIYKINLLEKLLATVLAKVSNFIPEGGIWMNTQRPEWNDANNALVGNGVSMVTLCYLRRFLSFFQKLLEESPDGLYPVSEEVVELLNQVRLTLTENEALLSSKISDADRKTIMDGLGAAGGAFREKIYAEGFSGKTGKVANEDLLHFVMITLRFLDHSIDANKRPDKLFHAYNIMTMENEEEVSISHLSEMLEGQVAVLSSGYISGGTSLELLDSLKKSTLFREDQYSYLLYPNKDLLRFSEKNNIDPAKIGQSELVRQLLDDDNTSVIEKDRDGAYHFNGNFNNAESLKEALSKLPKDQYGALIEKDTDLLLQVFEEVFDHKAFTGRSGTFFGYEGLGSIYWHMVSKLLLSVQETCLAAIKNEESAETIGRLLEHYYEINEGIGVHKSPELYGAIPTDPYSHTPAGKGAQQPGMTGQVKEDILSRFGELGVFVKAGKLNFKPDLLRKEEFLAASKTFEYIDLQNQKRKIQLEAGSLAFTYCQIPIIYQLSQKEGIKLMSGGNTIQEYDTLELDSESSTAIFNRSGAIDSITVLIQK